LRTHAPGGRLTDLRPGSGEVARSDAPGDSATDRPRVSGADLEGAARRDLWACKFLFKKLRAGDRPSPERSRGDRERVPKNHGTPREAGAPCPTAHPPTGGVGGPGHAVGNTDTLGTRGTRSTRKKQNHIVYGVCGRGDVGWTGGAKQSKTGIWRVKRGLH